MAFWLFILLNAVLFIRPAELVPALLALPIYQVVILACTLVSFPQILKQLDLNRLVRQPVTACVVGMLAAIALSHLSHLFIWGARYYSADFAKTVLYFLIFMGVVTSARKLEQFYTALLILLAIMAGLSLFHYYGIIYIPELDSLTQREFDPNTGEVITITRLQSTGIFNDPNDFGMILVIGVVLCFHRFGRSAFFGKAATLGLAALFTYLVYLTKSRGAALAFLSAMGVLVYARWGLKKAILAAVLLLPVVAVIFSSRQDGGVEGGTGQSRIQLWAEGMSLVKQYPIFGLGANLFGDEVGLVAHNSFVHCYAELGLFGGTIFFGCFFFAFLQLIQQFRAPELTSDRELRGRTATALAILTGATVSLLTLSRSYITPTYMVLSIAAATARLNGVALDLPLTKLSFRLSQRLAVASATFFAATYLFVRIMVRWA